MVFNVTIYLKYIIVLSVGMMILQLVEPEMEHS